MEHKWKSSSYVKCFACRDEVNKGQDEVKVGVKGLNGLKKCSLLRKDGREKELEGLTSLVMHAACKKAYIRKTSINSVIKQISSEPLTSSEPKRAFLRSSQLPFDFETKCVYCCDTIDESFYEKEGKKEMQKRRKVYNICTLEMKTHILEVADRRNDQWAREVMVRLADTNDLVASGAKYHQDCYLSFFTQRNTETIRKRGRPSSDYVEEAMEEIYSFLENNNECQFSVAELMGQITGEQPHERTVKAKLKEKYGDGVTITETQNRTPIVLFCGTRDKILSDIWYNSKKESFAEERMRIVETAAAIIKEDIQSVVGNTQSYPSSEQFLNDINKDIPQTLLTFLEHLLSRKKQNMENKEKANVKATSIAHAIMKCVRPRSISSPLQDALGLFIYRKYGSKNLISLIHNLGFCSSYNEVQTLEMSAIAHPPSTISPDTFVQFMFDNADFNIATIDGHNTFHSMGGIKCITPSSRIKSNTEIKKLKIKPSALDIGLMHFVPVANYKQCQPGLKNIILSDFTVVFPSSEDLLKVETTDVLWLLAKWLCLPQIPGWKAFMIAVNTSLPSERSEVIPLSFVKSPPSNYDTIFTVINMAMEECKSLNQDTCIITFDQPLYIKARDIVASAAHDSDLSKVVVRLGGFHLLMSFLGSIGEIMAGSGLRELMCTVYAPHSVDKMLLGHAFARAIRAHFLVQTTLANMVFDRMDVPNDRKEIIKQYLSEFCTHPPTIASINEDPEIQQLACNFQQELNMIIDNGPTATLWVQYFRMICLIKEYINAERSGNWEVHLRCIAQMIPIFHASGHILYAKSSHLYLQDMLQLPQKLSQEEYEKFVRLGWFTLRRNDTFWSGVWSDMLIEQTLMRNFKSVGGLTRGRGITDSTLHKYVQGIVPSHNICQSLESFAGLHFISGEQHVDFRDSRLSRDASDVQKLTEWLRDHPPFVENPEIMSIGNGVVGNLSINCYKAVQVGEKSLKKIIGKTYGDVKLARKDKVLSLAYMTREVKTKSYNIVVDPLLIFQRIAIVKQTDDDLADCFNYELAPYPLSLFEEGGMRKTTKSSLYDVFTPLEKNVDLHHSIVVIDGGFLLHRVKWDKTPNYAALYELYIKYVMKHFGNNCIIVFDGYEDASNQTKAAEQHRRARLKHAVEVKVEDNLPITFQQEQFLTNIKNKTRLIQCLVPKLRQHGFEAIQSDGDADVLIVTTAIEKLSEHQNVVVVGEDVDLLVLLVALTPLEKELYFYKPGKTTAGPKTYSSKQPEVSFLKENILFLHAFSGCDTTSAIYNQGKKKIVKVLKKNQHLKAIPRTFYQSNSTPVAISDAGQKMFLAVYGASPSQTSLNAFRYTWFQRSARKLKPDVASFPPTESSAAQHSFRVYHQIQLWLGNKLDPKRWGWDIGSTAIEPIRNLEPAAPDNILNMIFCSCKTGCGLRCGCRRAGITCTVACTQCFNVCLNKPSTSLGDEEYSDIDS